MVLVVEVHGYNLNNIQLKLTEGDSLHPASVLSPDVALSSRVGSTVVEEEANEGHPVPVERPRRRQSVSFTTEKDRRDQQGPV